jgi:hypothetical protein
MLIIIKLQSLYNIMYNIQISYVNSHLWLGVKIDSSWRLHLLPQIDGIRPGIHGLRDFCGIQLCIVLHCCAKWATGIPVICIKKQKVSDCTANYEPGGREFESLRARQYSMQVNRLWCSAWPVFLCLSNRDKNIRLIGQVLSPHTFTV